MKKKDKRQASPGAVQTNNQPVTAKSMWEKLPAWLQTELTTIASLVNNPEVLEDGGCGIKPDHFFQPECKESLNALLSHFDQTGLGLKWDELESKLKAIPGLKASEIEIHMGLLRVALPICEWHRVTTLLWFSTERRIFRGFSDAIEAMMEQEMTWRDAMGYLFQVIDLPSLQDNGLLARVQAAILKLPTCGRPLNHLPKEWEKALVNEDGTLDHFAVDVLSQVVRYYVEMRAIEGSPSIIAENPELQGVTAVQCQTALKKLCRQGFLSVKTAHFDEQGFLLPQPTAKALVPLLLPDEAETGVAEPKMEVIGDRKEYGATSCKSPGRTSQPKLKP